MPSLINIVANSILLCPFLCCTSCWLGEKFEIFGDTNGVEPNWDAFGYYIIFSIIFSFILAYFAIKYLNINIGKLKLFN